MTLVFDRSTLNITSPNADGTRLLLQDLYNQVRTWQALLANMDERNFLDAAGKQILTGSQVVGITLQFGRNWMVGFEAVAGPAIHAHSIVGGNLTALHNPTGTATSASVPGTTLEDTEGLFVRCAFQTGDPVTNVTDGSTAEIVDVVSETEITTTALSGGFDDEWEIGDEWAIVSTHPVFPAANIHITISQDTAPLGILGFDDLGINAALLRKIFLNRAETTINAGPSPPAGSKTIDFYDDDQVTIIDSLLISADGNTRLNP